MVSIWIATLIVYSLANSSVCGLPTFKWLFDCPTHINASYCMETNFHDNKDNDVAILKSKHLESDCIYEGFFYNESTTPVVVTSIDCPITELSKLEVSFASSRSSTLFFIMDPQEKRAAPVAHKGQMNKDIFIIPPFANKFGSKKPQKWNLKATGYSLDVVMAFDFAFYSRFKARSATRIKAIVAQAQTYFNLANSLGTSIRLNLVRIKALKFGYYRANEKRLKAFGTKVMRWGKLRYADAFAMISSENDKTGTVGIGYVGSTCVPDEYRNYRTTISEYFMTDIETGNTLAHEIGHNLGMGHDFIDPYESGQSRFCSTGQACTNVNGIMDYDQPNPDKWSCCSREDFYSFSQQVSESEFCLTPI